MPAMVCIDVFCQIANRGLEEVDPKESDSKR
jgi:hypothetical protein